MPTVVAVPTACPKCRGKLWDNRLSKRNSKAPDFKCRDKGCDGCFWPPKGGEVYADAAVGVQKVPAGPLVPDMDEEYGYDIPGEFERPAAPTKPAKAKRTESAGLTALIDTYNACWLYASEVTEDDGARALIAGTLFAAAEKP